MKSLRAWATPLTIATTLVTLITGVFLFFHWAPGLTRLSHEWIGMAMIGAVAAHMVLNWRPFTTYFRRPVAVSVMALGALAMVATLALSGPGGAQGPSGFRAVMGALGEARVETLAELAGQDTEAVLVRLATAGHRATPETTLAELSGGQRAGQEAILGTIFAR